MAKQMAYCFVFYHVALSSIHFHHHQLTKRFEENLYLGTEARNMCKILGIQYFCDINIEIVDPKDLNELIWFENPTMRPDEQDDDWRDIEHKYIYLKKLFNSTNFLWYD